MRAARTTSCKPINAEHARLIARMNGAPKGERKKRVNDLVEFMRRQLEADIARKDSLARQQQRAVKS